MTGQPQETRVGSLADQRVRPRRRRRLDHESPSGRLGGRGAAWHGGDGDGGVMSTDAEQNATANRGD